MSVAIAVQVFGSEVRVALMSFFRDHPAATQADAMAALGFSSPLVSRHLRVLLELSVVVEQASGGGPRPSRYVTDTERVRALAAALVAHIVD